MLIISRPPAAKKREPARSPRSGLPWGCGEHLFPGSTIAGEELEFLKALDQYKTRTGSPKPSWAEVLAVATALGYRKVAEPSPKKLRRRKKAAKPKPQGTVK